MVPVALNLDLALGAFCQVAATWLDEPEPPFCVLKTSSFKLVERSQYHGFQDSALKKILNLSEGYLAYLGRVHRQQHHPATTTPATMLIASCTPIPTFFLDNVPETPVG